MLSSADELAAVAPHAAAPEYVLTPGDQLEIKFFHNPELNQALPIRPDGRIALQLIGTVQAAGLTVAGLKSALDAAYATQLKLPDATIIVASHELERARALATRHVEVVGGQIRESGSTDVDAGAGAGAR